MQMTRECRVYVERDGPAVRKLYLTSIDSEDAGSYICQADLVGHRPLQKTITMMLFSAYSFIFHTACLLLVNTRNPMILRYKPNFMFKGLHLVCTSERQRCLHLQGDFTP